MDSIYQWAATLSQSGANYPTALPLKVDKLANGFQVTMCGNNIRYGDMGRGFTVWHCFGCSLPWSCARFVALICAREHPLRAEVPRISPAHIFWLTVVSPLRPFPAHTDLPAQAHGSARRQRRLCQCGGYPGHCGGGRRAAGRCWEECILHPLLRGACVAGG